MAGTRQPTDLVVVNGRKHLTKAEIEARRAAEVKAPTPQSKRCRLVVPKPPEDPAAGDPINAVLGRKRRRKA